MIIQWPKYDKLMHSYVGTLIALLTAFWVAFENDGNFKPLIVITTLSAGVLKEVYDRYIVKNAVSWSEQLMDIFFTIFNSFGIMLLMYLMDK